jgi:hypothetical protein
MSEPLVYFLHPNTVRNIWQFLKEDTLNNRKDIKTPGEYITEAKAGRVTYGQYQVVMRDKIK